MAAVYPDAVWLALRSRIAGTTIPAADKVTDEDVFVVVDSLEQLEAIERDRVTAVLVVQGPAEPTPSRGTCKDAIRFAVVTRYFISTESIGRALRDAPLMRARIKSLGLDEPSVNPPKVEPPTWDYQTFAADNTLLVAHAVAIDFEAIRPGVT